MKPDDENIEALQRAILRDAREEVEKIQAEARERAEAIRQQAQEQAEAERKRILERARQKAELLRSQSLAATQLKARTVQLEHREKLLEEVFKTAKQKLTTIQQRNDYHQIAAQLLREALDQLKISEAQVRADETTRKYLKNHALEEIAKESQTQVSVGEMLEQGIGVRVETADGRIFYDNTLETRLNRLQAALRSSVYQVLMGERL